VADLSAASSCQVSANPEMAWSLLGSAEIWSLRHGHFAFDAAVPGRPPLRCLLLATRPSVGRLVLTQSSEQPGIAATWVLADSLELTFSVRPHRRGAVMAAALNRVAGHLAATREQQEQMNQMLGKWLTRASMVLEGHSPWPAGMPAEVRRACVPRPLVGATDSVSASVLIAAPLDAVWEAVWSPASPASSGDGALACGHIPGTPVQEPGEMQYFISPRSDGRLVLKAVIVREVDPQHSAVVQSVGSPHQESSYLLTAETGGIQLEMTSRWARASIRDEPELARERQAEFVRSATGSYKAAIEDSRRNL
jgi:hypothetical protein